MPRPQVLQLNTLSADGGQLAASFRDLYPDLPERPVDVDPDDHAPYNRIKALHIRGQHFLPVYPGMWLGVYVYNCRQESILAPVTLRRTGGDWDQNLWRPGGMQPTPANPYTVDKSLCWSIAPYSGITVASQMDRVLHDSGDANGGRIMPFQVSTNTDDIPTIPGDFDELSIWRRSLRPPTGDESDMEPVYETQATLVCRVTLMWRTTAEHLLRRLGLVEADAQVHW